MREEGHEPSSLFLFQDAEQLGLGESTLPSEGTSETRTGAETSRWALVTSYFGTRYHGFATQEGLDTVGGRLSDALGKVMGHEVKLTCSGRTDSKVHAVMQLVSFEATIERDPIRALRSVNQLLPHDIGVSFIGPVDSDFDARRSATYRQYVYRISVVPGRSGLLGEQCWQIGGPLDVNAMRNGAMALIGHHDFVTFCKSSRGVDRPTRRMMFDISVLDAGSEVQISLFANSYCHQMVRGIVGLLVEVGLGKRKGSEVHELLVGRDRSKLGAIAPPHGLYLYRVGLTPYRDDLVEQFRRERFRFTTPIPAELLPSSMTT